MCAMQKPMRLLANKPRIITDEVPIQVITIEELCYHNACGAALGTFNRLYPDGRMPLDDTFVHNMRDHGMYGWPHWLAWQFLPKPWIALYDRTVSRMKIPNIPSERIRLMIAAHAAAFATYYNYYRS